MKASLAPKSQGRANEEPMLNQLEVKIKSEQLKRVFTATAPLLRLALITILIGSAARTGLVLLYGERVVAVGALSFVFEQGLRFDLVLVGMLLVPLFLLMPLLTTSRALLPIWKVLMVVLLPMLVATVLFLELATPSFIEQFDARPNRIFFEYFDRPKEVFNTLWGAYRLPLIGGVLLASAALLFTGRSIFRRLTNLQPVSFFIALPVAVVGVLVAAMMARSTLDHRPVNPSTVALTTDTMVNDLALNSTYTVAYAAYELRNEARGGFRYSNMPAQRALEIVKENMQLSPDAFLAEDSTWHKFNPSQVTQKPKNLVLIVEESLGAEFVGSLGGFDLTPNLDALGREGWWFEDLYATGTRSVRGLEAVTTGFLPTPARSVVKLSKSQRDFFSLASYLGDKGYDTSFIYGGEAQFDNMRRFFMGNGFQRVIDEKDYADPVFVGSWGVSDEDLLNRAHQEFEQLEDKPFFSLVFSSSNHTPFEFPDGRIEIEGTEKQTVNNAVKYADYAVGEFFKKAKASSYWDNTVFLVIADHNSRVYGAELLPVKRFHIPAVIVGGGIEPATFSRTASQVDMPPTLLSLIGVAGEHPMIGQDLTRVSDLWPGRAMMQFNTVQAYRQGDDVVVLRRGVAPQVFKYRDEKLQAAPAANDALIEKAHAHSVWASDTYQNQMY